MRPPPRRGVHGGAYTAAVESGVELDVCRLPAGHAVGIIDPYVKRRPQTVSARRFESGTSDPK